MHYSSRIILHSVKALSFCCILIFGPQALASGFKITEVAPGVYVHQGIHADLDDPGREDIANIGFVVGDRCVAVIDTGGSIAIGRKLKETITRKTSLPVCYVINTHVHFDHVLGNHAFKRENPKFVGHHHWLQALKANRQFFVASFANEIGPETATDRIVVPDTLVKKPLVLDLGNRKLVLTAYKTAHSSQDLSVLDEKTKTLWLSDLLFMDRIPSIDGSLKGWIDVSNKLRKIRVSRVIPGHGPVTADWPKAMDDQLRYLSVLRADIRSLIHSGKYLEDALISAGQSEKNRWLLFDQYHNRNVIRSFTELEWE